MKRDDLFFQHILEEIMFLYPPLHQSFHQPFMKMIAKIGPAIILIMTIAARLISSMPPCVR